MKSFLALPLLCTLIAFGQTKKSYLDSNYKETDSASAVYYREVSKSDLETYYMRTFYKSGQLHEEGNSLYESVNSYTGTVTTYWPNGNKKKQVEYTKARRVGPVRWWHENGKPKFVGRYEPAKEDTAQESPLFITDFWDETGKKTVSDGNGHYNSKDEDYTEEGELANQKRVGEWKGQDHSLHLTYEEEYDASGKLISGKSKHESGTEYTYQSVTEPPMYPGGIQAFYKFVMRNYRSPEKGPSGKLGIYFVVQKDGSLTNRKIVKKLSPEADAEGLRMLDICGNWIPGKSRGYPVRVSYSLPISIQVEED